MRKAKKAATLVDDSACREVSQSAVYRVTAGNDERVFQALKLCPQNVLNEPNENRRLHELRRMS
jgi:hypothetical protein